MGYLKILEESTVDGTEMELSHSAHLSFSALMHPGTG